MKLFISYRSSDSAKVDRIVHHLRSLKDVPYQVWQDKFGILPGEDWWQSIVNAIIDCNTFLFMVSRESVQSPNCKAELSYARKRNRPVVPIVLEDEFTYNPKSGKNDIDYWSLIPREFEDLRSQFLFYEGTSFMTELARSLDYFQREPHRWVDFDAPKPPDPRPTEEANSDSAALYDQACDYAERLDFASAERIFQRLVNADDAYFGQEAREWIPLLRKYAEMLRLDAGKTTRFKAESLWPLYIQQFPKPFLESIFDPKGLAVRYGIVEGATFVPLATPSVDIPNETISFTKQLKEAKLEKVPTTQGRRILVYLVLDTSDSMCGSLIKAVEEGLEMMATELRKNPYVVESMYIAVITFSNKAEIQTPLVPVEKWLPTHLTCGGGTNMAEAFELVSTSIKTDLIPTIEGKQIGDYKPLIFILTDGIPNDMKSAEQASYNLLNMSTGYTVGTYLLLGCGPSANATMLRQIAQPANSKVSGQWAEMPDMTPENLKSYFSWLIESLSNLVFPTSRQETDDSTPIPNDASGNQVFRFGF